MGKLNAICLRLVRWTGWLLLPVVLGFLATGWAMSGRYGMTALTDDRTALALHRLMHVPLATLLILHVLPSTYLAMARWGWWRDCVRRVPW